MKSRRGFVSNSSSSSFVILGYKSADLLGRNVDKEAMMRNYGTDVDRLLSMANKYGIDDAWYEFLYNTNFGIDGVRYLSDDGDGYVGVAIADVSSDGGYLEKSEVDIDTIMEKVRKLQELFGIDKPPKIITGTRSC